VSSGFEGLIFDCDGTLIDSMPVHWHAWSAVTRRHGLVFTEDRFYALGGVPAGHILQMLCQEQGVEVDVNAVAEEKEQSFLSYVDKVKPIEPVVAIVREWQGRVPMAVATGGIRPIIPDILEQLDLLRFFETVVTSQDVTRQKPAPDIFLEAARRIRVSPAKCRAFEDTDLGMKAIQSAGMDAVDVRLM
jgi:beta-phosphoglucomutase family hydrolase